jgi:uncharacterized membrane protein
MSWLKAVWAEVLGLFVDDTGFAVAILVWLVVAMLVLKRLGLSAGLPPVILFAGLVAILVESAVRGARRSGGR